MPIALNGLPISTVGTSSSTILPSWSPAANDFIAICVAHRDETKRPTITGNGLSWSTIAYTSNTQGQCAVGIYGAFTTATPAAGTILVSFSAVVAGDGIVVIAQRFSGVSFTSQVEATAVASGPAVDDNDMLYTVSTVSASAWVIAAGCSRTTPTLTLPAGETSVVINASAGAAGALIKGHLWHESPIATSTTVTMGTLNDLSANFDWCMALAVLQSSTAAPAGPGGGMTWLPQGGIFPISIWGGR